MQDFRNTTPMDREITVKKFIHQVFNDVIIKTYKNNPLKSSPMEGYAIMDAMNKTNKHLIDDIPSLSNIHNLPSDTIRKIIQEVYREVYDKTFEK